MKQRIITGAIMAVIFAPIVYFGGLALDIVSGLLCVVAAFELQRMFNQEKEDKKLRVINYLVILFSVVSYVVGILCFKNNDFLGLVIYLLTLFILNGLLLVFDDKYRVQDIANSYLTILYSSVGFIALSCLRNGSEAGLGIICYVLTITVSTDVFAYFFGVKFGKHKLCPKISPKKSVEGAISGTVFAIVLGTLVAYLFRLYGEFNINIWLFLGISLMLSIICQFGDLFASRLKRYYGIKDYSNIFPGHGGVLDRFDSLIFALSALLIISLLVG